MGVWKHKKKRAVLDTETWWIFPTLGFKTYLNKAKVATGTAYVSP